MEPEASLSGIRDMLDRLPEGALDGGLLPQIGQK